MHTQFQLVICIKLWYLFELCRWCNLISDSSMTFLTEEELCSCEKNGNTYTPMSECSTFTQYDNITQMTYTHSCPGELLFSLETCGCDYPQLVQCQPCAQPAIVTLSSGGCYISYWGYTPIICSTPISSRNENHTRQQTLLLYLAMAVAYIIIEWSMLENNISILQGAYNVAKPMCTFLILWYCHNLVAYV